MRNERGIALVFVLFLLTTVSALAVSLTFLANSETYASGNYRLVTQARYGAESGLQKASDFLLDPLQYNPATVAPGGAVDATVSPVTWNGTPVVLHSVQAQSHYPDAATEALFAGAAVGDLTAGTTKMTFGGFATLLTEELFLDRYTGNNTIVQTWQLTSDATVGIGGIRTSTVEVSGMIETRKVPGLAYAAFGVAPGCAALAFNGNVGTDSYNSATLSGNTTPTFDHSGGDVGTNGNLTIVGHVGVEGNLYSPKVGVGACDAGNVTALTQTGAATVTGGAPLKLPKVITFPTPAIPAPSPLPAVSLSAAGTSAATCPLLGLVAGVNCSVSGSTITIANTTATPLTLPSLNLDSHVSLVLTAPPNPAISNTYNINSISLAGQAEVSVKTTTPAATVVVSVSGKNPDSSPIAVPIDFVGGTFAAPDLSACPTCSVYDAKILEFMYGGTGEIRMTGNSGAAATFYAPKAAAVFSGTADLYGAIIADTISAVGTFNIHYDDSLANGGWTKSSPMMTAFSWKKN